MAIQPSIPWCEDDRDLPAAMRFATVLKQNLAATSAPDVPPLLIGFRDHAPIVSVAVNPAPNPTHVGQVIADVGFTITGGFDVDSVVQLSEAYLQLTPEGSTPVDDMAGDFARNPATRVMEALGVARYDRDVPTMTTITRPFTIGDGQVVQWRDELVANNTPATASRIGVQILDGWALRARTHEVLAAAGLDARMLAVLHLLRDGHNVRTYEELDA